jgi:hypothetical protein
MTIPAFAPVPTRPLGRVIDLDDDPSADIWSVSGHAAYLELTRTLVADPPGTTPTPWSLDLPWGGRVELVLAQVQKQAKAA